jgi:hypothetical protein
VTFSADQRAALKKTSTLPAHIEAFNDAFEHGLTEEEYADRAYRYRVAFVPIVGNRASSADVAIEFVRADSDEGREIAHAAEPAVRSRGMRWRRRRSHAKRLG